MDEQVKLKSQKLALLEEKKRIVQGLPHLYGHKFYPWMREYWESTEKIQVLSAGNQIGKSTTQIRKVIHWATEPSLWPKLWPHMKHPRLFLYFYPSSYLATIELENKWTPEILPRDEFKDHPQYGWAISYRSKYVETIKFNSGVTIAFKTYSQSVSDLQASSPALIAIDEECPAELMPEIQARLLATNGYLLASFTPTQGQEFWREVVEVRGYKERFPEAFKRQISMYDCQYYEDGTPSHWTTERIEFIKRQCASQAEIDVRVYGKFSIHEGLRYPGFSSSRNLIEPKEVPVDWPVFVGVDSGSGGERNHPAAIACVAMSPDYKRGYVIRGRRMDGQVTTAGDIVDAVNDILSEIKNPVFGVFFDYSAHDLGEIAAARGNAWMKAEKSHGIGEQVLNVAFKNSMLHIFNIDELQPLVAELKTLKKDAPKTTAIDDYCDALRYGVSRIPWDWSSLNAAHPETPKPEHTPDYARETTGWDRNTADPVTLEEELEAFNDLLDSNYGDIGYYE